MKMAKASDADMETALKLCSALEAVDRRYFPDGSEGSNDPEDFDLYDDGHCGQVLRHLHQVLQGGSIGRVIWGMYILMSKENEFIDPNADTLELHPELVAAEKDAERYREVRRVKELELDLDVQAGSIEAVQAANSRLAAERDTLRAELAEIEKAEPVAWRWVWKSKPWDIEGWCYTNTPQNHPELQEIEKLFTRHMPAQDAETGMINLPEPVAWLANYGGNVYTEAQLKQAVRDALDVTELVEALEALIESTTGVDQVSVVNDARTALSKYKGAK